MSYGVKTIDQAIVYQVYQDAVEACKRAVLEQLIAGKLFAFGSKGSRSAAPVWIPVKEWKTLREDPNEPNAARYRRKVYYNVRVITAEQWFAKGVGRKSVAWP